MFLLPTIMTLDDQLWPVLPASINIADFGLWPYTATAGIYLKTDGQLQSNDHGSLSNIGGYVASALRGSVDGNDYEAGVFSLSFPIGTGFGWNGPALEDTYYSLGTIRDWYLQGSTKNYDEQATFTLKVRRVGIAASEATCPVTLTASVPFT